MSYKYDFFISYSRQGSVQKWLLTHFYNKLVEYLADELSRHRAIQAEQRKDPPRRVHLRSAHGDGSTELHA